MRRPFIVATSAVVLSAAGLAANLAFRDDGAPPETRTEDSSYVYEIDSDSYGVDPCGVPPYKPCEWSEEHDIGISQEQG